MNRVPPEIDGLMWAVADNPTQQSIEEFAARFPAHRGELMRRVNMVRGLRNEVQPTLQVHKEIPAFRLRELPPPPQTRSFLIAGLIGAAALAAACFTVVSSMRGNLPKPYMPVEIVHTEAPKAPVVVYSNSPNETAPLTVPSPITPQSPPQPAPDTPEPEYLRSRPEVRLANVSLVQALNMITSGTGIHLTVGPGFVDQKISIEYHDKNTVEMLQDLSRQYAFTISDEGNGEFLAIPVPDSESPANGSVLTKPVRPVDKAKDGQ